MYHQTTKIEPNIFSLQNVDEIINEYWKNQISMSTYYTTLDTILYGLSTRFLKKKSIFFSVIVLTVALFFSGRCFQIEYYTNSFI